MGWMVGWLGCSWRTTQHFPLLFPPLPLSISDAIRTFFYDGGREFGWLAFAAGGPSKYLSLFLPITSGYCDSKNTSLRGSAGSPEKAPPPSVSQPSSERVLSPSGRKRRWTRVLSYRWVGEMGDDFLS